MPRYIRPVKLPINSKKYVAEELNRISSELLKRWDSCNAGPLEPSDKTIIKELRAGDFKIRRPQKRADYWSYWVCTKSRENYAERFKIYSKERESFRQSVERKIKSIYEAVCFGAGDFIKLRDELQATAIRVVNYQQ